MWKIIPLGVVFLTTTAIAAKQEHLLKNIEAKEVALEGSAAIKFIYGKEVRFLESIGYYVTWRFMPDGHLTMIANGKKFIGQVSNQNNDVLCTTFESLNNLKVCHKFILRGNKLTKIDQASQIGSEGLVLPK